MLCYTIIYILCYVMWYYAILCYVILYNVILYYAIHQVLYYTWSVDVDPPRFALAVGQSLRASRRKCRPLVALVALGAPLKWWLSHIIYIYIYIIHIYILYIYIYNASCAWCYCTFFFKQDNFSAHIFRSKAYWGNSWGKFSNRSNEICGRGLCPCQGLVWK